MIIGAISIFNCFMVKFLPCVGEHKTQGMYLVTVQDHAQSAFQTSVFSGFDIVIKEVRE